MCNQKFQRLFLLSTKYCSLMCISKYKQWLAWVSIKFNRLILISTWVTGTFVTTDSWEFAIFWLTSRSSTVSKSVRISVSRPRMNPASCLDHHCIATTQRWTAVFAVRGHSVKDRRRWEDLTSNNSHSSPLPYKSIMSSLTSFVPKIKAWCLANSGKPKFQVHGEIAHAHVPVATKTRNIFLTSSLDTNGLSTTDSMKSVWSSDGVCWPLKKYQIQCTAALFCW